MWLELLKKIVKRTNWINKIHSIYYSYKTGKLFASRSCRFIPEDKVPGTPVAMLNENQVRPKRHRKQKTSCLCWQLNLGYPACSYLLYWLYSIWKVLKFGAWEEGEKSVADRQEGEEYPACNRNNERTLTGLVTSCTGTAFYNTVLKER